LKSPLRRLVVPAAFLATVGLALTGCSSTSAAAVDVGKADGVVTIAGSLTDQDATRLEKSWADWSAKNHIKIVYTGSKNFDEQIGGLAQEGNAPDLGIFEQPGLLDDLATRGYIKPIPATVAKNVSQNFTAQWASYTTVGKVDYASPLLATLKGWVWYSPKQFAKWGVSVPKTWGQLIQLTGIIQATTGTAPWCEGFNSDADSGSAGTDWIEDMVLREDGPAVYDQWVAHKISFSDPRIKTAFDDAAVVLQNGKYVNAGRGGVASINTTTEAQVAKALESGTCALTHQPSSFNGALQGANSASNISPNGDFWAFMLPPISAGSVPVTGGGDFVAAFSNDADTMKVQQYLSTTAWARSRVAIGGVISPNTNVSWANASSPLLQESTELLQSPKTTFRFDASDLMPSIVGSGTFWTGMVDWINGTSTNKVVSEIDKSWPDN
jgi:alpha-glucoside transport system substrate-binding protein